MSSQSSGAWYRDRGRAITIILGALLVTALVIWALILIAQGIAGGIARATRTVSVTVSATSANGPEDDINNTHGATVCVGQVRTNPSNCAKTNDQGVAQIPVGSLQPGSYGILVIKPGQTTGYWAQQRAGLGSQLYMETIPADGTPPPVTVTIYAQEDTPTVGQA